MINYYLFLLLHYLPFHQIRWRRRPVLRAPSLASALPSPKWGLVQDYRGGRTAWPSLEVAQKSLFLHLNASCLTRATTQGPITLPLPQWRCLLTSHVRQGENQCANLLPAAAPGPPLLMPGLCTQRRPLSPPWPLWSFLHMPHGLQASHCSIFQSVNRRRPRRPPGAPDFYQLSNFSQPRNLGANSDPAWLCSFTADFVWVFPYWFPLCIVHLTHTLSLNTT